MNSDLTHVTPGPPYFRNSTLLMAGPGFLKEFGASNCGQVGFWLMALDRPDVPTPGDGGPLRFAAAPIWIPPTQFVSKTFATPIQLLRGLSLFASLRPDAALEPETRSAILFCQYVRIPV